VPTRFIRIGRRVLKFTALAECVIRVLVPGRAVRDLEYGVR